jgi:hypothetical protein
LLGGLQIVGFGFNNAKRNQRIDGFGGGLRDRQYCLGQLPSLFVFSDPACQI